MASMATSPTSDKDPRSLQELAVDIVTDIHKLATGLAHAGAPPNITAQIEQTSTLYGQLAKGLAAGPVGQRPVSGGAPAGAAPAEPASAPPSAPGAPAPSGPGPGGPQAGMAPGTGPAHGAIHAATQHLQAAMQLQAQRRAAGQ